MAKYALTPEHRASAGLSMRRVEEFADCPLPAGNGGGAGSPPLLCGPAPVIHTVSSVKTWRTCRRLYLHKYVYLYRPQPSRALAVGSLVHRGLELFDGGLTFWDAEELVQAEGLPDEYAAEAAKVLGMLAAYWLRWEAERDEYEVVEVEGEFRDGNVAGKRDAVWRHKRSGRLYLVERKTTSDEVASIGDDYWQRLALDLQVTVYQDNLAKSLGEDIGILYDVIRKPQIKPKLKEAVRRRKGESDEDLEARKAAVMETPAEFADRVREVMLDEPDKYFVRREVHRTREQNEAIMLEFRETCAEIDSYRGAYPRNDSACQSKWGRCPFLGVCVGAETLESEKFTKLDRAHSELGESTEESYGSSDYSDIPI